MRLSAGDDTKSRNNYGVGFKSGTMTIGRDVLILSKSKEPDEHGNPDRIPIWGAAYMRRTCKYCGDLAKYSCVCTLLFVFDECVCHHYALILSVYFASDDNRLHAEWHTNTLNVSVSSSSREF